LSTTKTSETGTTIAELQASRDRYNTAAAAAAHNLAEAAKGAAEAISQGASAVGAMAEIHFLTGIVEAKWAMARAVNTLIHDKRTENDHGNRP
jgi:malate synthase